MSSHTELLREPELSALVSRALQAPENGEVWDRVADQIVQLVERRGPSLGFGPRVGQDVLQDGVGHLFEQVRAGKWNPEGGHFAGWAWRVLHNLGRQAGRSQRGRHAELRFGTGGDVHDAAELPAPGDPPLRDDSSDWQRACSRCRQLLDSALADAVWPENQVDYTAVFLWELRRAVLTSFARALQVPADVEVAPWVAAYVRWHPHEQALRMRSNHATIGVLWHEVVNRLAIDATILNVRNLCELIPSLAPHAPVVMSVATMIKWSQRARQFVRERMEPADWQRWFAHWWSSRL